MFWQIEKRQALLILLIITSTALINGFTSVPSASFGRAVTKQQQTSLIKDRVLLSDNTCFPRVSVGDSTRTAMASTGPNAGLDGTGLRGQIPLAIALLISVWLFTIPPEFRRAHICTNPSCVANRASCSDCQTFDEVKDGITQYYKNGGGIKFDFSIDPTTIEQNKEFLKTVGL